jgi:hypothetical protein
MAYVTKGYQIKRGLGKGRGPLEPLGKRRCLTCRELVPLDAVPHARFCSQDCRAAYRADYKRAYMKIWKAENPDYFSSDRQRERLRKWNRAHPTYFKARYRRLRRILVAAGVVKPYRTRHMRGTGGE